MIFHMLFRGRTKRALALPASLCALSFLFFGCATFPGNLTRNFNYAALAESQSPDPASNASIFAGSVWEIDQVHPSTGNRVFRVRFFKNRVLQNLHPNDKTPSNDRWDADENSVNIFFNDSYAVYHGTIETPSIVAGTARNNGGDVWSWQAEKVSDE
jgi:hypothetical protein